MDVNELIQQILALKLQNPVSGFDVDAEDICAYIDDFSHRGCTVDGFKLWLLS